MKSTGISRTAAPDVKLPLRKRFLKQLAERAAKAVKATVGRNTVPLVPDIPRPPQLGDMAPPTEIARDASTGQIVAIKWGRGRGTWHAATCVCSGCVHFIAEKIGAPPR